MNIEEINLSGLLTTAPLFGIDDANKKLSVNSNATGLLWTPEVVPTYTLSDADKKLTVNSTASDLEWRADSVSAGYISERGDGSSNTESNSVGFVYKNKLKSGLFNYTSGINDILALKIDDTNIFECTPTNIFASQNINFPNDTLLSSQRINFGIAGNCGISGDSSTGTQNAITFRTDNQERLRISTNNGIVSKSRIKFDNSVLDVAGEPLIYRDGTFLMGISFDSTYGTIRLTRSATSLAEFNYEYIYLGMPVQFKNPVAPEIQIVEGTLVTANANLQGKHTYYLKRSTTGNSEVNFPPPLAGFNVRYELITDTNGNTSSNVCRISTLSRDVLQLVEFTGVRTLFTGSPVINLNLNAHFIMQFIEADNRWLLMRTTQ